MGKKTARPRPVSAERELAKAMESSKAPAISRAAAVLRLLGKSDRPLGVQAIARELGIVPSTCLYLLRALAAEELVSFDADTKRYSLEAGVLTLARHWLRRNRFTDLAQPALDRIAAEFGVTMMGVQIVGLDHIIVVAVAQSGQNFQLSAQVGTRFPALISATGRCIAAFEDHPEAELKSRFGKLRWDDPPTFEEWQAQVARARTQGFAVDAGHYMAGVTVIAAPIHKSATRLSHALVAIGIGAALKKGGLPALQEAMVGAAGILQTQLGGDSGLPEAAVG